MQPADARNPILAVSGLCKTFGTKVAVDDVSFDLCRGESLGIVGESGSGKSTTARILVGLETKTAGEISIETEAARGRAEARRARARAVQMIFQDPYQSFDPKMPIGAAIEEPLRLHTELTRAQRALKVAVLLDQVGLSARQGLALPSQLSGGQRQRAAIARALGIEPKVLVLDEAVAALDVSIQAQILMLLNEIREQTGVAYIFVSHDLAVVQHMTDSVLVMRLGKVVESGQTRSILSSPEHPYTRLLLESIPRRGWDLDRLAQSRRDLESLLAQ
ncbi:ABC transporter ATP-binding protein [Aeromicrobium sp. Root236]|uniref:ABC transporter ATP-binding protein n=1 Tax=Aeromicrobium sp. Root236 TaxID=1736498 RepID=UPI00191047AA|nr:ATP-binding cassette domain-containing protein [Aeromicrobium sp. Root236]